MVGASETDLWHRSIGATCHSDGSERCRIRLVSSLEGFRERAALLAGEIARDHPEFTIHDESHFDALWRLADLIAGPDFELTPAEAFVFGGAVLVHDLGMATAAYTDGSTGANSLRTDPRWPDKVAFALRSKLHRAPTKDEIASASPEVISEATSTLLRELHAERAEWLVKASWEGPNGSHYSLLEDSGLRDAYGPIIGLIAHSHWWTQATIGKQLDHVIGAAAGYPSTWTVRPLTIACLLRLADASHLDASRAPRFLQALRRPSGQSKKHWDFQARLAQPFRKEDRLVFTSAPFGINEAEAWWLCADRLKLVDYEFRSVDTLLAERREVRFAARSIDGAHDLHRLAEHLPVDGWLPVDAKVRVSDVVSLVKGLGGEQLYGSAPHVPLRELLQNGADAVRARRVIQDRDPGWGNIVVRLGKDQQTDRLWLEVEDTGVGMSPDVLSDHLLDFGSSFWSSEAALTELPGLASKGFESTGRFGIGFFSVFMWSNNVTVTSRKHDASTTDTHVLEFGEGLAQRPILRRAEVEEQMIEAGTRVRVGIDTSILWRLGLADWSPVRALAKLCAWLAPALDITLSVESGGWRQTMSTANDWMDMRVYDLAMRVRRVPLRTEDHPPGKTPASFDVPELVAKSRRSQVLELTEPTTPPPRNRSPLGDNGRTLHSSDGKVAGRALLDPIERNGGVLAIGGFNAGYLNGISGIFFGSPLTASRHSGTPGVCAESLAAWASEQATLVAKRLFPAREFEAAALVRACGGETGPLPVALTSAGWLNKEELRSWVSERTELQFRLDEEGRQEKIRPEDLHDDFVSTSFYVWQILRQDKPWNGFADIKSTPKSRMTERRLSLFGVVVEVVDDAWSTNYIDAPDLLLTTELVDPKLPVLHRRLVRPSQQGAR